MLYDTRLQVGECTYVLNITFFHQLTSLHKRINLSSGLSLQTKIWTITVYCHIKTISFKRTGFTRK
jgi:hypothetical protein